MRSILLATTLLIAATAAAAANQIIVFGQTSGSNTVTGFANAGNTATTLSVTDATVNISQLFGNVTPISADYSMSATSIDVAQTALGLAVQHFSGSFCITSGLGCTGTDYLSGTFTDAAVGAVGGPGLVVNVNNPPDTLALSSSVIASVDLAPPSTFDLSFSNVVPSLNVCGSTLCSFTAAFAGDASASVIEPSSLAVLGLAVLGLGIVRRRTP